LIEGTRFPTIRSYREILGLKHRARSERIWHSFNAPDEGNLDLPAHQEPPGSTTVAGPQQAGKHSMMLLRWQSKRRSDAVWSEAAVTDGRFPAINGRSLEPLAMAAYG
jgi:hypothetical protein